MKKSRKLARIQCVQQQIYQRAEVDLSAIRSRAEQIKRDQHEVLQALNTDEHLQGLFVEVIAGRLRRLSGEAHAVNVAIQAQQLRVLDCGLKMKRTEKLLDRTLGEERALDEKATLADITELLYTKPQFSGGS